jgi:arsenate reductase
MSLTLYHNPRCSKSRQTLQLLHDRGLQPVIIDYLKTPPNAATLATVLAALNGDIDSLMRPGEDDYKAAKTEIATMNEQQKLNWLAAHPQVLQRPIIVNGDAARIGRPPESVLDIL